MKSFGGSFGELDLYFHDGKYYVNVKKVDINRVVIVALNSGSPGIVGPNIEFNVSNIVSEINEKALAEAETGL